MPSKDKGSKNTTQETIEESLKTRVLKDLSRKLEFNVTMFNFIDKTKIRECMGIEAATDVIE